MAAGRVVSVRRAGRGDEEEVERFADCFDHDLRADETNRLLVDDRHILLLGYLEGRPAGFLSAVEVFHPDKAAELFLNELGVVEGARRHGVARELIEELGRVGRERGCGTIWVLTDEGNRPAMALYASTGGKWDGPTQVMFEYDLDRNG